MAVEFRTDVGGWMRRWDAAMAAQAALTGDWPNQTVAQFALRRATATPSRIQLIDGDLALTCAEIYARAQRLAGYFLSIGLTPGDVISFQLPNWWEASVIDIASSMTGIVTNPIVPINRDAEVTYMLNESRSRVMFVPEVFRKYEYAVMMRRIAPALRAAPRVVVVRGASGDFARFDALLAESPPLQTALAVDRARRDGPRACCTRIIPFTPTRSR
jgi:non-ribosomal peptide synthetase component E (peptide arylation enzyme)